MSHSPRNALIAGGVVLLHVAALWALQSGLLRRAAEVVVPVELLSAIVTPPQPEISPTPPAPPPPRPVEPVRQPIVRKPTPPAPAPAPRPVAAPDPAPAPTPEPAVAATAEPQPAPPPISAPVAATPAPPAPAPAARVELPISDADYLHNPPPAWPRLSERLGERGVAIVRVLIGTDGRAKQAQIGQSSGYPRLDQASVTAALGWRYVPGKRGGVPEEMWVNVPIRWGQ
jgi:protein TonB